MTCICGHHEHAHAQDVGLCAAPEGCNCNHFRKAPAVHDGLSMGGVHWHKARQDAEWLAGSEADTAERNLARAFLAMRERLIAVEGDLSRSRDAHNAAIRQRDNATTLLAALAQTGEGV